MSHTNERDTPPASLSDAMVDHLIALHELARMSGDDHMVAAVRALARYVAHRYAPDAEAMEGDR